MLGSALLNPTYESEHYTWNLQVFYFRNRHLNPKT